MGVFIYVGIMEGKKSFLIYCELIHTVKKMSNEDAWLLLKHMLDYTNDKNPEPPNTVVDLVFEPIKQQLKRDLEKWKDETVKRSEAGKKWMKSRRHNNDSNVITKITNDNTVINPITNITDNVNVNVNVNDNVNVNVKEKKKKTTFYPPTITEVEQYFITSWYSIASARKAWTYYDSAWWIDSNWKKVLNWKQKMISVRFKEENKNKTAMKTLSDEEIAERTQWRIYS